MDGEWVPLGTCTNDPDVCVNGELRDAPDVPCGPNGLGAATETCEGGQWVFAGLCDECGAVVYDGDVTVFTASDLAVLQGVNRLTGDLRFAVNDYSAVDFSGLESLSCIDGDLKVTSSLDFTSFHGLDNVLEVGGIEVSSAFYAVDFEGLGQLRAVRGNVLVRNSNQLQSFTGLEQLTHIDGALEVYGNSSLASLDGLEALTEVYDKVALSGPSLASLQGLGSLESVGSLAIGRVSAQGCGTGSEATALSSLDGLESLTTITLLGSTNYNDPITLSCSPSLVDVTALAAVWPHLSAIADDLTRPIRIQGTGLPSLAGMEGLARVYQLVIEDNDALVSLGGLSGLVEADTLEVIGNDSLLDLSGLSALQTVKTLTLRQNQGMASLAGLTSLSAITDQLYISQQSTLTSLDGLENVTTDFLSRFELVLWDLPQLEDLSALAGVSRLRRLRILGPLAATSLTGLHNLAYVEDDSVGSPAIWLEDADALSSLNGLQSLQTVEGGLRIKSCDALVDLSALGNLSTLEHLEIVDNPQLPNLHGLEGVAVLIYAPTALLVSGNGMLTSLSGLDNLTSVATFGAVLVEGNPQLQTLHGLEQLQSARRIQLRDNAALADVSALGGLQLLDDLLIEGSPSLTTLPSFTSLTTMDELRLEGVPSLVVIGDLGSLEAIGFLRLGASGRAAADDLPALTDLSGLAGLTTVSAVAAYHLRNFVSLAPLAATSGVSWYLEDAHVSGLVGIAGSTGATAALQLVGVDTPTHDLAGLEGLTTVAGVLVVDGTLLQSLDGTSGLAAVSGSINIRNNDVLASITDLSGLESVGGTLRVMNNPQLPRCQAQALLDDLVVNHGYPYAGSANLTGNNDAATCN